MKFYRSGEFKEDILNKLVEINPKMQARQFLLSRLDYLLGFLENHPDYLIAFVEELDAQYQALLNTDQTSEKDIDFGELEKMTKNLREYPSLLKNATNYYLQTLNIQSDMSWDTVMEVPNRNYHQAFLHPRYYSLLSLINIMGRKEAIKLWKRFVTQYIIDNRTPREPPFVDLETLLQERMTPEEEPSDWVVIKGMIADGKYAYRNDNCLWVDSLEDLPDSEIKYYVCCYGDYEAARNYHDSIVLTMEHTIANGDPYCSRVLHDTRIDYDLGHPPKDFWDNMWPVRGM
ncbi:MAG: L-2-amino-thiazoline-4-carboxylic acid hydrolase [Candidatus Thorarchaeota archaeon]